MRQTMTDLTSLDSIQRKIEKMISLMSGREINGFKLITKNCRMTYLTISHPSKAIMSQQLVLQQVAVAFHSV
jgi:hypothetical protein